MNVKSRNYHSMPQFTSQEIEKLKSFFHVKESPEEREIYLTNRAKKYIGYLQYIPGILFVGVGNSVAMNTAHSESDIDLFIISEENRIWTVRILSTLIISLLGLRKTSLKHKDQFCLSFFITEKALNFQSFALQNDIYLYFWVLSLKPILDYNTTYDLWLKANNEWIPFYEYQDTISENKKYITYSKTDKKTSGKWIDSIENTLKRIFLPRTLASNEKLGNPFGVIIEQDILKFHAEDKRKVFRDEILGQ